MLEDLMDKAIRWVEAMSYEEYFVMVLIAIAVGFVFLKGFGSRQQY